MGSNLMREYSYINRNYTASHMTNFTPLGDIVMVKEIVYDEIRGFKLPDECAEKRFPDKGTVVAIGTGKAVKALGLNIGDEIILPTAAPHTYMELGGNRYRLVRSERVIGKIER
jgi:co-chaperonin GroES (HSP10)